MREGQNLDAAKRLRGDMTDTERLLWSRLRNRQIDNLKFRRQAPIDRYVVDFLCAEHKLIVELDGGQHNEPANTTRDQHRTEALQKLGYTILRFWNNDVIDNIDGVLEKIAATCLTGDNA